MYTSVEGGTLKMFYSYSFQKGVKFTVQGTKERVYNFLVTHPGLSIIHESNGNYIVGTPSSGEILEFETEFHTTPIRAITLDTDLILKQLGLNNDENKISEVTEVDFRKIAWRLNEGYLTFEELEGA